LQLSSRPVLRRGGLRGQQQRDNSQVSHVILLPSGISGDLRILRR
jgi:hypothetical protein